MAGTGTGLSSDPRIGTGGLRPSGQYPPQYLCQWSGGATPYPATKNQPGDFSGRADHWSGGLCGIIGHGNPGRDQCRPPSAEEVLGNSPGHYGLRGLGGPCEPKAQKRISAHEYQLRHFSSFDQKSSPPLSRKALCRKGLGRFKDLDGSGRTGVTVRVRSLIGSSPTQSGEDLKADP
jgi:hypothetical protein